MRKSLQHSHAHTHTAKQVERGRALTEQLKKQKRKDHGGVDDEGNRISLSVETPLRIERREMSGPMCFVEMDRRRHCASFVQARWCYMVIICDRCCQQRSCEQTRNKTLLLYQTTSIPSHSASSDRAGQRNERRAHSEQRKSSKTVG